MKIEMKGSEFGFLLYILKKKLETLNWSIENKSDLTNIEYIKREYKRLKILYNKLVMENNFEGDINV